MDNLVAAETQADMPASPPTARADHGMGRPPLPREGIPDKLAAGVNVVAETIAQTQGNRGFVVSVRLRNMEKIRGQMTIKCS